MERLSQQRTGFPPADLPPPAQRHGCQGQAGPQASESLPRGEVVSDQSPKERWTQLSLHQDKVSEIIVDLIFVCINLCFLLDVLGLPEKPFPIPPVF